MKKLARELAHYEDNLLETLKHMNQFINNVRQTLAHWLLFNKNASLFVKK